MPLTPAALTCFKALHPLACGSRFVLPARQTRRTRNHGGAEVPFEQRTLNAMPVSYTHLRLHIKRRPDSIFDYAYEDFEVQGYDPHPAIKAAVAV